MQQKPLIQTGTRVRQINIHAGQRDGTVTKSGPEQFTVKWDRVTVACHYDKEYLGGKERCQIITI